MPCFRIRNRCLTSAWHSSPGLQTITVEFISKLIMTRLNPHLWADEDRLRFHVRLFRGSALPGFGSSGCTWKQSGPTYWLRPTV